MAQERATTEGLRKRLSNLEGQVAKGSSLEPILADTKARLKDAETEVERLRNALDNIKQQMKVWKEKEVFSMCFRHAKHFFHTAKIKRIVQF